MGMESALLKTSGELTLDGRCFLDLGARSLALVNSALSMEGQVERFGRQWNGTLEGRLDFRPKHQEFSLRQLNVSAGGISMSGDVEGRDIFSQDLRFTGALAVDQLDAEQVWPDMANATADFLTRSSARAAFDADALGVALGNMTISLPAGHLQGNASLAFGEKPFVEADFAADHLDIVPLKDAATGWEHRGDAGTGNSAILPPWFSMKDEQAPTIRLRLDASQVDGQEMHMQDVRLDMEGKTGSLGGSLRAGGFYGGGLQASVQAGTKEISLNLRTQGTDLARVELFQAQSGRMDMEIQARGDGRSMGHLLRSLQGEVKATLTGAAWRRAEVEKTGADPLRMERVHVLGTVRGAPSLTSPGSAGFLRAVPLQVHLNGNALHARDGARVLAEFNGRVVSNLLERTIGAVEDGRLRLTYDGPSDPLDLGWPELDRKEIRAVLVTAIDLDVGKDVLLVDDATVGALGLRLRGRMESRNLLAWLGVAEGSATPAFTGSLLVRPFVPVDLLGRLGLPLPELRSAKALHQCSLRTDFSADKERIVLRNLDMLLDGSGIRGWVSLEKHDFPGIGDKPLVRFDLDAERVNVDDYRPAPRREEAVDKVPSDKAPELGVWKRLRMDGTLRAGMFRLYRFQGTNVEGRISAKDGAFTAAPVQGDFHGGAVHGGVTVDLADQLRIEAQASAESFDLETLLADLFDYERIGGNASMELRIGCQGWNYDQRIGSLHGEADLEVRDGYHTYLHSDGEEPPTHDTIHPRGQLSTQTIKPDKFSKFSWAKAVVTAEQGLVRNQDLELRGALLHASGEGLLDLPAWQVDYRINYRLTGLPTISVNINGSLDDPKVDVEATETIKDTLGRIGGTAVDVLRGVFTLPFNILQRLEREEDGSDNKSAPGDQ
jgi:hypothetical protein